MDADDCGLRKKVCNSGEIATWDAHVVHENDLFEFELGDNPSIRHQPALDNPGKPIGAYSIATLKSGEKSREVMSIAAIEKVRSRSRAKDNGPWVTDYEEMCRKTVARRQSKVLPMSTDLDDLLRRDDDLYDFEGARDEAKASEAARPRTLASLIASRSPRALRKRMYMLKLIPASKINRRQRRPLRQTPLMRRPARRLRTPPPVTRLRRTSPTNRTRRRSHWTRLNKSDGQEKAPAANQPPSANQSTATVTAPRDRPVDPLALARKRGGDAYRAGHSRKAVPPEYRTTERQKEAFAWQEGFDAARAEDDQRGQ